MTPQLDLSARANVGGFITRSSTFDGSALTGDSGGTSLTFTGYASVFNRSYDVHDWIGSFSETIAPGAFRDSLAKGADVPFKINHDGMTLARTRSGTMQLSEDANGLHVEAKLDPANPQVQALRSAMERGDIDEMSFSFRTTADTWSKDWLNRTVTGADIHKGDVSAVNYGANPFTTGAVLRSADIARALRGIDPTDLDAETREALMSALGVPTPDGVSQSTRDALGFYAYRIRALSL